MLDEVWNEQAGMNCLVWVDEQLDDETIALGWQICNDAYVSKAYLSTVCIEIFEKFSWVNVIETHYRTVTREHYEFFKAQCNGNMPRNYELGAC